MKVTDQDVRILDSYRHAAIHPREDLDNYKGYRSHALAGLHDFVAEKIAQSLPLNVDVLDLGAGSGAMSARLMDSGYRVTAMDLVPENFRARTVPFVAANLNQSFAAKLDQLQDGVVAIEVLEHLENPRHFLRECLNVLRPGGHLFLSTPNIDSPASKSLFIRYGWFRYFDDRYYSESGHIVPISYWQLKRMIAEVGLTTRWLGTFGDSYEGMKWYSRTRLLAKGIEVLSPPGHQMLRGQIIVAVLQKSFGP
jgi:SAM-dependent methyltransferase